MSVATGWFLVLFILGFGFRGYLVRLVPMIIVTWNC